MQRDICILTWNYLKKDAIVDLIANVPALYYIEVHTGESMDHMIEDRIFLACSAVKLLRLWHAGAVGDTVRRLMDLLADIFYLKRYVFDNLHRWLLAGLKFLLAVHYFACGWILIHRAKDQMGLPIVEEDEEIGMDAMYVNSFYLMTTTITTVGYGDYKGFTDTDGEWYREMIYLIFVTVIGIVLFAIITNEIFTYRYPITVKQIVLQKRKDMELYMWTLSAVRKNKGLEPDMVEACL